MDSSFIFSLITIPVLIWLCRRALALNSRYYLVFMLCLTGLSLLLMKTDYPLLCEYGRASRIVCSMEFIIMGMQAMPFLLKMMTLNRNYLHEMPMYCFVSERLIFSSKHRAKRAEYWATYECLKGRV